MNSENIWELEGSEKNIDILQFYNFDLCLNDALHVNSEDVNVVVTNLDYNLATTKKQENCNLVGKIIIREGKGFTMERIQSQSSEI